MKNLKLAALIIFLFTSIISTSQVTIFKTYNDFKNRTGQVFDELTNYKQFDRKIKLILTKKNVETTIACKDIWGFIYKDALFRIDKDNGGHSPTRVIAKGKLVYYENGMAHLDMLWDDTSSSYYDGFDGYATYISKDINSFMIPIEKSDIMTHRIKVRKGIKKFKNEYPQFNDFFKCLRNYRIETVRRCIAEFEGYEDFN